MVFFELNNFTVDEKFSREKCPELASLVMLRTFFDQPILAWKNDGSLASKKDDDGKTGSWNGRALLCGIS